MVVRLVSKDGHRAVDLLDGHYSYHLVGERHLREGQLAVGTSIDGRTETVGTANDKCQIFAGRHLLLQEISILNRPEFLTVFVQQDYVHSGRQMGEDGFAFGGLELFLTERLGVFDVGNDNKLKRDIVFESLLVFIDKRSKSGICGFAYYKKGDFHSSDSGYSGKSMAMLSSIEK